MRTWRYNESNGIYYYYVGNARVGTVSFDATKTMSDPSKWRAFCRLTVLKSLEHRATVEEAKSAVEDIVTRWLERAGLVERDQVKDLIIKEGI